MNNHRFFHQRVHFDSKRGSTSTSSMSCKYCKKPGHTIDKCYKLYDFSPDFKFTKNKRSVACVRSRGHIPESISSNHGSYEVSGHGFSREQSQHLMTLFQQIHTSPAFHHENNVVDNFGFANFAGVYNHPEVHSTFFIHV